MRKFAVPSLRRSTIAIGLALTAVSLIPIWPVWKLGFLPATHDWARYAVFAELFARAQSAGAWLPRWLPELNGGYGYPVFVFYQPGYFIVHGLLAGLVDGAYAQQLATTSFIALVGSLGCYRLAREQLSPGRALLVVAAFQCAPYVDYNLNVRGDLSEWLLGELVPWCLFWLQGCIAREGVARRWAWIGLSLATAAGCYAHPAGVLFLPPLLAAFALALLANHPASHPARLRTGFEIAMALLLAMSLASPYWFSVLVMKSLVTVDVAQHGAFETWRNTLPLARLLFGSETPAFLPQDLLGAPFVLLALSGAWLGRRIPLVRTAGLGYLLLILLMSDAGQLFWRIYPYSTLQFPWRLAVLSPTLLAITFIGFLSDGHDPRWRSALGGAALLLSATWAQALRPEMARLDLGRGDGEARLACLSRYAQVARPGSFPATLDGGEWTPLSADLSRLPPARGTAPDPACAAQLPAIAELITRELQQDAFPAPVAQALMVADAPQWQGRPLPGHGPQHLAWRFEGPAPGALVINQLYLPGWKVAVDDVQLGRAELERQLLADGRMRIALTAGSHEIRAQYEGPLYWRQRNAAIALVGLLMLLYWRSRRAK